MPKHALSLLLCSNLKLFNRQCEPLMSMRKPIAQRNANDSAHDRARVVHRSARNRQKRRERQEDHTVNSPSQAQAVDGQAPFAQTPWAGGGEAAFEAANNDEGGRHYIGRVEAEGGEGGSEGDVSIESWHQRLRRHDICLQGVECDSGADGNDVDDEADARCDQDCIDRNAQGGVYL